MQLRRILVAYDGSEDAFAALEQAVGGVASAGTQVDLVVVGTPQVADPEAAVREGVTYLLERGFHPRVQVLYGEPGKVIRALAANDHYDGVYLGARGLCGPILVTWQPKGEPSNPPHVVAGHASAAAVAAR